MPKARRTESGYRVYTNETIERLEFILKAKTLGLKLSEIKEIVLLHEKGEVPCECTKNFIKNKVKDIEEKNHHPRRVKDKTLGTPQTQKI